MAISPLMYQVSQTPKIIGPTVWSKQSFGTLLMKRSQSAHNALVHLMQATTHNSMLSLLERFPTKELDDDDTYTWDVICDTAHNVPLVEARTVTGEVVTDDDVMVGANVEPFYLVFDEHYFAKGETLEGELNEIYPMRVIDEPREEGTRFVYKVELMGGNTTGIPGKRLKMGERFSTSGLAYVETTLSRKVGGVRTSTFMKMRNEFSTARKYMKVGGDMQNAKIDITMPAMDGDKLKKVTTWMPYLMYLFEKEWREGIDNGIMWGRLNRLGTGEYLNFGDSGMTIKTGAGIMQQMEAGNVHYFTKFSLRALEDALGQIFYGKTSFGKRKVVICTGEAGLRDFHRAVTDIAQGWHNISPTAETDKFIRKTSSEYHSQSLELGWQYTKYLAPNGIVVEVKHCPSYDDRIRNKIKGPDGLPLMSHRMDIFDMGDSNEPNIYKVKVKGFNDMTSYQWGLRNPFTGQQGNAHMSYDEDSASIHKMTKFGAVVLDPTRTMSFIPAGLLG